MKTYAHSIHFCTILASPLQRPVYGDTIRRAENCSAAFGHDLKFPMPREAPYGSANFHSISETAKRRAARGDAPRFRGAFATYR